MSTETLPQITPKSSQASQALPSTASSSSSSTNSTNSQERRSLRAKAMSPSTVRKAISLEDRSSNDLFSPTSAAAIALSSLHQFGAQRDNRAAPPDTELKGTRLFNNPTETPAPVVVAVATPRVISQETTETSNDATTSGTATASTTSTSNSEENKENTQTTTNDVVAATTTTTTTANNNNNQMETRVPPATFTPSYHHHHHHHPPPHHHHHQTPPYPAPPPHHHHPHHHPAAAAAGQPPQQQPPYNHQAPAPPPPHSWRRGPLPMHHPANYVARYPYTHAQMDPSYTAGWEQQQAQQQQPQHSQQQQQPPPPHTYNRASPVSSLGPYATAPMPRPPGMLQHPPPPPIAPTTAAHSTKFARLASCASTLVTPTPKKAKLSHSTNTSTATKLAETETAAANNPNYSRKKKSLGILAENFLNTYKCLPKGSTIVVDEAAVKLGVERRRIYDVVNILESICLVCKKHKNTYTWMGMEHLNAVFGRLQAQAIVEYPQDAQRFLGTSEAIVSKPVPLKPARKQSKSRENKSLAKLSQEFLQVFLVGHQTLSLPEASDKIQGTTSVEELIAMGSSKNQASTEKELKAAAARGLKTKIRRLYDIANVFLSVGLLKKVDRGDASRRPNFSWAYVLSAKEVYEMHRPGANAAAATTTTTGEAVTTTTNTPPPSLAEQQPPHPPLMVAQEQPAHPTMVVPSA